MTKTLLELKLNEDGIKTAFKQLSNTCQVVLKRCADKDCQKLKEYKNEGDETPRKKLKLEEKSVENLKESNEQNTLPDDLSNSRKKLLKIQPPRKIDNDVKSVRNLLEKNRKLQRTINDSCTGSSSLTNRNTNKLLGSKVEELDNSSSCSWKSVVKPVGRKGERSIDTNRNFSNFNRRKTDDEKNRHQIESLGYENSQSAASEKFTGSFSSNSRDNNQSSEDVGKNSNNPCSSPKERIGSKPIIRLREELNSKLDNLSQSARREPNNKKSKRGGKRIRARLMRKLTYSSGSSKTDNISSAKETEKQKTVGNSFNLSSPPKLTDDISFARLKDLVIQRMLDSKSDSAKVEQGNSSIHALTLPATDGTSAKDSVCGTGQVQNICLEKVVEVIKIESDDDEDFLSLSTSSNCNRFDTIKSKQVSGDISKINTDRLCERKRSNNKIVPEEPEENEKYFPQHQKNIKHQLNISSAPDKYPSPQQLSDSPICSESFSKFYDETFANKQPDSENLEISCVEVGKKEKERPLGLIKVKDPASLGIFVPSGVLPENALSCKNTNIEKKIHSLPYSLDNPPSNESNNVTYNVKTPENSAPCNVTVGNNNISIYLQVGVSDIVKNQLNSNGNINNNCSLNSSANSLETNKRIANFNQECSKACSRLAKIVQMSVDKNSNTSSMERRNSIQNTNTEMNLTNSHNLPHSQTSLVDEIIEGMQNFDHTYTAQRSYNIQKEKSYPSNRATHKLADTSPLGHNQSPQIQLKTYSKQIVDLSMNKNIIDSISQQHFAAVSSSANLPKGASISVSSSNIEKKHHDIPSHTNSQPFNSTVANVIHAPISTNSYSPIPSVNTTKPQSLPVAVSNETQHNIKSRPPIKSLLKGVQSPSSFHSQMSKFEQVNPGNKNLSQQQAIPDCPTDNNTLKSLVDNLNKNLRSEIRLVNVTDMKEQQPLEHSITTINEPQKCISTHSPQENTSTIEQTTNVSTSPHSLLLDELDLAKIENMYQIIQSTINLRHEKEHNMQILGKAPVFDLTMYSKLIKHFDHSQAVMASTFVSLLITLLKKADSNGINRKKVIMLVFVRILEHSFSDNDSVNVCKKIKNCIIDLLDAFKLKMGQCSASLFSDISLVMRLPDEVFDIAIAITCETIVSPINQFYCHRDYDLAKYSDQIQMFIRNSDLVPFLEKCTKYFDLKNTLAKTSVDVLGTSAMKHDKLSGSNSSSLKKQEEKSGSNKGSSLENAVEPKTNSDRNFAILDSSLTKQIKSSTIYSASKIPVSGALFRDPTEPSIADSTRQAIVANSPFKRPVESSNNNSAEIMSQELLPCLEKAVEPRNNSVKNVRVPAQLMKKPIDSSINGSGNKISVASSLLKDPVESLKTNSAEIISNKVSGSPLKNFLESSHNNLLTLENNVGPSNSKIRIVNAPPRQGIQLIDALPLKGRSFNKPKFVLISKDQSKTKTIFVNKTNASVIQNMRKQFTHSNPALITPKPQPLGNPGNLRNSSNNNPSSAIPSETPVGNNHDPLLNKDVDTADLGPIIIDVRSLQDDDNSNFNFDTVEPSSESSKTESSINSHSTKYSCNFHSNEPQVTNKTVETPANLPNSQATNMQQNTAILVTSQAAMNYAIQSKSFDSSKSPTSSDTSSQVSSILGENQVGDITVQKLANQSDSQSLNNSSKIRYQKQILILQKSDIQSKPQSSSEAVEKKQTIFEYPITKIQLNKNKLDSSQLAMKGALQKPVMLNKLANMDVQKSANPDATQIASKSSVRPIDNKATKAITPEVSLAFPENPQVSCSPGLDANKTVNLVKYHTTNNLIVLEPSAIPNKSQATISINLNSKSILKKPGSSSSATIKAVSPGDSNASTGNAIIIEVPSSSSTVVEEATNVPVEESGRVVKAADSVSETIGNTPKPNKDIVEPTVLKHNLPQQLEYSSQHQMQQLKIAQIAKPLNTQSKPATCGSKVISDDIQKTLQDDIRNTLNQRFNDISLSLGYQCLYCERTGVRRKAFVQCSVCKTARYCDAICQRYDWTVHKAECIPFDTE